MALVDIWEWERTVRNEIRRVIEDCSVSIVFQGIHRLDSGNSGPEGYEALARFPYAPGIPAGLWFRVAENEGLSVPLELAAARAALASPPPEGFLTLNSTPAAVPLLLNELSTTSVDVVIEMGRGCLDQTNMSERVREIRAAGAQVSIDDLALSELYQLEPKLTELLPDFVKVDLLGELTDDPMSRFNLVSGLAWTSAVGIDLVVERVEQSQALRTLRDVGVGWAQGYGLNRPLTA